MLIHKLDSKIRFWSEIRENEKLEITVLEGCFFFFNFPLLFIIQYRRQKREERGDDRKRGNYRQEENDTTRVKDERLFEKMKLEQEREERNKHRHT